jgi:hypothetical protein
MTGRGWRSRCGRLVRVKITKAESTDALNPVQIFEMKRITITTITVLIASHTLSSSAELVPTPSDSMPLYITYRKELISKDWVPVPQKLSRNQSMPEIVCGNRPLVSKMKNDAIDLSFRFKSLSMRPSDDSKSTAGKSFKLLDLTFVSQPAVNQG